MNEKLKNSRFEAWKKCEDIAIHFNDLLIKLRTGSLSVVITVTTVIAATAKAQNGDANYKILFMTFLILEMFWVAIWILDFNYYNRLLGQTVKEVMRIEEGKLDEELEEIKLSTTIESKEGKDRGGPSYSCARWTYYILIGVSLVFGMIASCTQIEKEKICSKSRISNLPTTERTQKK